MAEFKTPKNMPYLLRSILYCSWAFIFVHSLNAATLGLPFTEGFNDSLLEDSTLTTADWSEAQQKVLLTPLAGNGGSGAIFPNGATTGEGLGSEADNTSNIVLGDVNNDGYLDLVAGNHGEQIMLYLNDGSGNLADGSTAGVAIGSETEFTESLALGDVNNDGWLDIVAGNSSNQQNTLYLNDGLGGFADGSTAGITIGLETQITTTVALGDVNKDGWLDLVAGNYNQQDVLYLNDGSGAFADGSTSGIDIGSEIDNTRGVAFADVNNDGWLDLVAAKYGEQNTLYLNDGSGGFADGLTAGAAIGSETQDTYHFAVGDVNNDGWLDLVAGNFNQQSTLYLNDGSGGFADGLTSGVTIGLETQSTTALALGDVNNDGWLDFVTGNNNQQSTLYLNDGAGGFADGSTAGVTVGSEMQATRGLVLGDVNNDAYLDLATASYNQQNTFYLNDGDNIGGYNTSAQKVVSLTVNGESLPAAIIEATEVTNTMSTRNTSIDYWLTNDGGNNWVLAHLGGTVIFPSLGNDLRWKAKLNSLSPLITPELSQILIDGDFDYDGIADEPDPDLDNDGVLDAADSCDTADLNLSVDVDADGCDDADEDLDDDNDGVLDVDDACVTADFTLTVDFDGDGCDDVDEDGDDDNDGVLDATDSCLTADADISLDFDSDGCDDADEDLDDDNDGVLDINDVCVNPGGFLSADFDNDGCDDADEDLDDDNDGVLDVDDSCLTADGHLSADLDGDGCDDADEDSDDDNDGIPDVDDYNRAPELNVTVKQGGEPADTIFVHLGAVYIDVVISDDNTTDTHTLRWYFEGEHLSEFDNLSELVVATENLKRGSYEVVLEVSDNGEPAETVNETKVLEVDTSDSSSESVAGLLALGIGAGLIIPDEYAGTWLYLNFLLSFVALVSGRRRRSF